MLKKMPLSINEFADISDNALFRAIKTEKWDDVRKLMHQPTSEIGNVGSDTDTTAVLATTRDKYGNTPLHALLGYKCPDDTIIFDMLNVYPEATAVHGSDDWLPLHVAAMWGVSSAVLEQIIRCHPDGLDDRGQDTIKGRTPRFFSARFSHNTALLERPTRDYYK